MYHTPYFYNNILLTAKFYNFFKKMMFSAAACFQYCLFFLTLIQTDIIDSYY
jgi:hypothetical protein